MSAGGSLFARRLGRAAPMAALVFLAVLLVLPVPARAQLGAGQLQKVHALTVNTAAWAVLRQVIATLARDAGLTAIADSSDAVDTATVVVALNDDQRRLDAVLAGSVRAGLVAQRAPAQASGTFAQLGLSRGQALGIACIIFGQSPEKRRRFATLVGLSARDQSLCPRDYQAISNYWLGRLSGILRAPGAGSQFSVAVQLDPAAGGAATARALLIAGQTLEQVAGVANSRLALRRNFTIRGTNCNASGGAISSRSGQIILCYKMLADIANDVARGIVGP
ncbi:MAG: hypothetical protein ACTSY1_02230 [Alphaproteobacteria bacterium]